MFFKKKVIVPLLFSEGLNSHYSMYFSGNQEEKEEYLKLTLSGEILLNKESSCFEWLFKFFSDAIKMSDQELSNVLSFLKAKYPEIKRQKTINEKMIKGKSEKALSEMLMILAIPVEQSRRKIKK